MPHTRAASSIGTLNGFGTMYYGWRHLTDSTATRWVTLFYVPVLPLQRHRLRILTDFESEVTEAGPTAGGLFGATAVQAESFEVVKQTPVNLGEIAVTYLKTFLGLPALMLWPGALCWSSLLFIMWLKDVLHPEKGSALFYGILSLGIFSLVSGLFAIWNFFTVPIMALRSARGMRDPEAYR